MEAGSFFQSRFAYLISKFYETFFNDFHSDGLRILVYHSITSSSTPSRDIHSVSLHNFKEQINWLKRESPYKLVRLQEGLDRLKKKGCGPMLAITFDDGYKDAFYTAAPILEQAGVPYTVYVVNRFTENGENLYLNKEELRALSRLPGAEIGSHSYSHQNLSKLPDIEINRELSASRHELENLLEQKIVGLGYPYGAYSKRVISAAKKAGFEYAVCSRFGFNKNNGDPYELKRIAIMQADDMTKFQKRVLGHYDWYCLKQALLG